MTFGFTVNDATKRKLFTPSGKCYVLYRVMNVGSGKNKASYHDTGISRTSDPVPLCFVRSTEMYTSSNTPPLGCVFLGRFGTYNDQNHIITAENTRSVIYLFMPGNWVENKEGKQKWGARFYDEDGEVSFCGWQKPLIIDGYISSEDGTSQQLRKNTNAILMRALGEMSLYIPSMDPTLPVIFFVTGTAYNGRSAPLFKTVGLQGGGANYGRSYKGHIPYIDASIYE